MEFLLDANMPRSALRALTDAGHQAWHVRDIGLGDASDERIDRHALAQGWVLVTRDLDFATFAIIRQSILQAALCCALTTRVPPMK